MRSARMHGWMLETLSSCARRRKGNARCGCTGLCGATGERGLFRTLEQQVGKGRTEKLKADGTVPLPAGLHGWP